MSSSIEIPKTCIYCQKDYMARTTVTRYCSHTCNQRHYKEVKRQERIQSYKIITPIREPPKSNTDFFTITNAASLLGISDRTIFRLIARGIIIPTRKGRRVLLTRNELFKTTVYENIDS